MSIKVEGTSGAAAASTASSDTGTLNWPEPESMKRFQEAMADGVVTDDEFNAIAADQIMSTVIQEGYRLRKELEEALRR